jgi:hypothetical protein
MELVGELVGELAGELADDLGAGVRGGVRGGMNAESYAERGGQGKDGGLLIGRRFAQITQISKAVLRESKWQAKGQPGG